MADTFSKRFEDKFAKIKTDDAPAEEEVDHAPSLDEKTRFAHAIYKIKPEELGTLVEKLDERCPEAIDKVRLAVRTPSSNHIPSQSANEEEIEINVDAIDPKTFHELDRYRCFSSFFFRLLFQVPPSVHIDVPTKEEEEDHR